MISCCCAVDDRWARAVDAVPLGPPPERAARHYYKLEAVSGIFGYIAVKKLKINDLCENAAEQARGGIWILAIQFA
jgi:hypothetical protein